MKQIVFLVEERSMKEFLNTWVTRTYPEVEFRCISHEGKRDLLKSIPRKLKAWRTPGVRFVVIIDNDNRDCKELKAQLLELCRTSGRDDTIVRIACQELEAWYLGDLEALSVAFGDNKLRDLSRKKPFHIPDKINNPSNQLSRLVPQYQKISGARVIASHIDRVRNKSTSFKIFANSIDQIASSFQKPGSNGHV